MPRITLRGSFADKRDEYLIYRRARILTAEEYRARVQTLERQQTKYEARLELARRARADVRAAAELAKQQARIQRQRETLALNRETRGVRVMEDFVVSNVWDARDKLYKAGGGRLIVRRGGDIIVDDILNATDNRDDYTFQIAEAGSGGKFLFSTGDRVQLFSATKVPAVRLVQRFRDGVAHCVMEPVLEILRAKRGNGSADTQKRLEKRIRAVESMALEYADGVPEGDMERVAQASGVKIHLYDTWNEETVLFNTNGRQGVLRLKNTRANHLDVWNTTLLNPIECSVNELLLRWKKAKENGEWWEVGARNHWNVPSCLHTGEGTYVPTNDDIKALREFDERIGIRKYGFRVKKHPEVAKFLRDACRITPQGVRMNDGVADKSLDMRKAYTQFRHCEFYSGFLGVIHQWGGGGFTLEHVQKHIGIYQIVILKSFEMARRVGLVDGMRVNLTSVMIQWLASRGMEMEICSGVWGSRFDFDFSEEMLGKTEDEKLSRYAYWTGKKAAVREFQTIEIPADDAWASHLTSVYGEENVSYWKHKGVVVVRKPFEYVKTVCHIPAFITDYLRIQILTACEAFPAGAVKRIVVDAIDYSGEEVSLGPLFEPKDMATVKTGEPWFSSSEPVSWEAPILIGNTLISGQGGCGKTHRVLTHGQFNDICYITPTNLLGMEKKETYGVNYTTIHSLVGIGCQPRCDTEFGSPAVLLIDEATMIEGEWIERAFKLYPQSLVIVLGDLDKRQWFQCRGCGNGADGFTKMWDCSGVAIQEMTGDYRARNSPALMELKSKVRAVMRECFTDGGKLDMYAVQRWICENYKIWPRSEAVAMFQEGDTWIAGTHKTNLWLLENGVVSGWKDKRGAISKVAVEGWERRGSFTTHAFQGQTVSEGKLFISIRDQFEYAMLYTAISRAVAMEQIVFVD